MKCETMCSRNSKGRSITAIDPVLGRLARIVMCLITGAIKLPAKCKQPKRFGANFSVPLTHGKNLWLCAERWQSMIGRDSRQMIHSNAETVTSFSIWILPSNRNERRSFIRRLSRAVKKPALTAIKALPINYQIWPVCPAGSIATPVMSV